MKKSRSLETNRETGSKAYAAAGVDLNAGEVFSAYAGKIGRASSNNSHFVEMIDTSRGHFRGLRGWKFQNLPDGWYNVAAPDGIGTATILISVAEAGETAASRLIAMTAGDLTRKGGLPLIFINVLETKTLGVPGSLLFRRYQRMMDGLEWYAADQHFVIYGGETAEMGVCVGSEIGADDAETMPVFNWSAVMVGANHPEKQIDGSTLKPGQRIVALRDGLRSNGASLARRYLAKRFGQDGIKWWQNARAKETVAEMARPAVLYDKFLSAMNGWYDRSFRAPFRMHAIAHITGGGIISKFANDILFPQGLSANLSDLWEPPKFMKDCVSEMQIGDKEAYTILTGGQGALVVIDDGRSSEFCAVAKDFRIEARDVGEITRRYEVPRLRVHSKFSGKWFKHEYR